jgi:hypothetical protein
MLSRSWHIVIAIDNDVAALQVHGVLRKKQAHGTLSGTLSIVLRVVDDQLAVELEANTGEQSVVVMGIERLVVRSLQSQPDWVAALTAR